MKFASSVIVFVLLGLTLSQAAPLTKSACLNQVGIQEVEGQNTKSLTIVPKTGSTGIATANLAALYPFLTQAAKEKIATCQLNLAPALKRCESANGVGKCETDLVFAQVKCPAGTQRFGCCVCSTPCPAHFEERGYYCYKPNPKKSLQYANKELCETSTKTECEQWTLDFWVPKCLDGFRRVGADQCIPTCPEGWVDSGRMCFKPVSQRLGAPFAWTVADN